MDKLDIEFKFSSTGMYSSWHLDIAHKHNVPLMVISDIGELENINNWGLVKRNGEPKLIVLDIGI